MNGNAITVVRYTSSCFVCSYPLTAFVQLGGLPCRNLRGEHRKFGWHRPQYAAAHGQQPEPPGPYVLPSLSFPLVNYTDQWWDPAESGWGIVITQHVDGAIFATWAVYGPDNKPVWYTLQPGSWSAYNTYSGPVYLDHGPVFWR